MKITLRAARVNAGLTLQQVHEATGFARSTLTRWEKGISSPKFNALSVLCKLYGVAVDCVECK